ncbi:MAG: NIPSNAP family protein [Caulobacteraceae bacterium]|nr:NIPSNAP family protein [Caulobacteraceae bacterium]
MIYELRVYTAMPGKLPKLVERFERDTLRVWAKHGIRQAGFWTTLVGPKSNDLMFMLAWESLADREARWGAFQSDPEWIAARADSEKDGPIVANMDTRFLSPTAYSAVK